MVASGEVPVGISASEVLDFEGPAVAWDEAVRDRVRPSNSGEAAGGAAPNLTRGCPDGSAELPAGQPRMAAGLPRSHTAPLPRRRVIVGTAY